MSNTPSGRRAFLHLTLVAKNAFSLGCESFFIVFHVQTFLSGSIRCCGASPFVDAFFVADLYIACTRLFVMQSTVCLLEFQDRNKMCAMRLGNTIDLLSVSVRRE